MQAFIFDFNGTLFQDADIHRVAWKRFMQRHGRPITDAEFYEHMYGPGNDEILRKFLGEGLTDAEVNALSEEKEADYREIVLADPSLQVLAPGAAQMLDMLVSRRVPCAVATASIRANVDFYLDTLGLSRWFDLSRMFYMTGDFPGKPDPAIYRLAMEGLGVQPKDTTVVEDSMSGIRAAVAAVVGRVIAVDTTMGPEALSKVPGVDAVIHDFCGFERFLEP